MMTRWVLVCAFGSGLIPAIARSQMHVVKKPETVVRAVGVYEFTGEEGKATASRLVPVSVFINNTLEDAGVYLARPVPFALETGTIFELEKSGAPQATLELAYERHLRSTGAIDFDESWLAYGAYKPLPKPVLVAAKKSGPLPKVQTSGGPHFSNKADSKTDSKADDPDEPTLKRPVDRSSAASGTVSATGEVKDPDAPTMRKRTDSSADSTVDPDSSDNVDRPTLKKRTPSQTKAAQKAHDQASVASVGELNDDPDRPNLHRGKPVSRMEEDELPPLVGLPKDMKQLVAVSDAKNRPEHNFARPWESEAEHQDVLTKIRVLARARLSQYDSLSGKLTSAPASQPIAKAKPAPATRPGARRKPAAPPPPAPLPLNDEALAAYTLSYGGAATFVFTASTPGVNGTTQYLTVVAQQESQGSDLKTALASVTDSAHLDRTPWMRLIDVVDAEASNRASILFELRAQNSRQFALYGVVGASADQAFITGTAP